MSHALCLVTRVMLSDVIAPHWDAGLCGVQRANTAVSPCAVFTSGNLQDLHLQFFLCSEHRVLPFGYDSVPQPEPF